VKSLETRIQYRTDWLLQEANARDHITDTLQNLRQSLSVKSCRVVELGSGIGTNLMVFEADNQVLGVEGMAAAVEESKRRGIPAVQANLERGVPLPSNSVDLLLCIDVLEHLMDPAVCLREAHRLLLPTGQLIINVPNHFDWRGRLRILRGSGIDSQHYFPESPHWEYPHVRFFSRRSIERLLNCTGFVVRDDLAPRYLSFPKAHIWNRIGLKASMLRLQHLNPDLFTSGFFLRCEKA